MSGEQPAARTAAVQAAANASSSSSASGSQTAKLSSTRVLTWRVGQLQRGLASGRTGSRNAPVWSGEQQQKPLPGLGIFCPCLVPLSQVAKSRSTQPTMCPDDEYNHSWGSARSIWQIGSERASSGGISQQHLEAHAARISAAAGMQRLYSSRAEFDANEGARGEARGHGEAADTA